MSDPSPFCKGTCKECGVVHSLPVEPAQAAAHELMEQLNDTKQGTVDTDFLYGDALGKMFGVLLCENKAGETLVLKAFSGQYNGIWEIEGWVAPLFNVHEYHTLNTPAEKEIKQLGRQLEMLSTSCRQHLLLKQQRKKKSQELMKKIHKLYRLHNFQKQQCTLADFFPRAQGIPTGTGDCCAPKLLNHAAVNGLKPVALAEFYWGKTNRSATRIQGQFYPACEEKCAPILGFLLCGANEL